MCGIFGIVSKEKLPSNNHILGNKIINSLKQRGPDDSGIWFNNTSTVMLVHTRLSVIDLTASGHQPMTTNNGRYTITYNGEIYNFKEIKSELSKLGYSFNSASDTEVILYAFSNWGVDCVNKFEGMFAFAIWDELNQTMWLFRDRVGVKPIYYYHSSKLFIFSSELRAIHVYMSKNLEIDRESIGDYLQYGYIPSPRSIYTNIYKLDQAHYMCLNNSGEKTVQRYWTSLDYYNEGQIEGNDDKLIDELETLLHDSFSRRLISDVPVGVFLSGGIDSSLVAAMIQSKSASSIKTFTISFDGYPQDESIWAQKVADHLGTDHTVANFSVDDAMNTIRLIPEAYDEPFSDNSSLPTMLLSKITRDSVKVALSGDGADELFCGYKHYNQTRSRLNKNSHYLNNLMRYFINAADIERLEKAASIFSRPKTADFKHYIYSKFQARGLYNVYNTFVTHWYPSEIETLLGIQYRNVDKLQCYPGEDIQKLMLYEFDMFLPDDILVKVDRASMHYGLEAREPFLDQKIIEFAVRLPFHMKNRNGQSKYILRKILNKYLPEHLINRPKQGFVMPVNEWLCGGCSTLIDEYLNVDRIRDEGIFDHNTISYTINKLRSGKTGYTYKVWNLLMFQLWKERWFT